MSGRPYLLITEPFSDSGASLTPCAPSWRGRSKSGTWLYPFGCRGPPLSSPRESAFGLFGF